jgi:hypothetical protein
MRYVSRVVVRGGDGMRALWAEVVRLGGEEDVVQDCVLRVTQQNAPERWWIGWKTVRSACIEWLHQQHDAPSLDDEELADILQGSVGDALDCKASSAWGEIWASPYRTVLARELAEELSRLVGAHWVLHLAGAVSLVDAKALDQICTMGAARDRREAVCRIARSLV